MIISAHYISYTLRTSFNAQTLSFSSFFRFFRHILAWEVLILMNFFDFLRDLLSFGGYINNPKEAFLKPLSPKEEAEFIRLMGKGDDGAREKLIEHNLRLVAHIAKKYAKNSADIEDYISIGTIGLIKGINTFSASKGRLAAYISKCAENEILMYLRSAKKTAAEVSLQEPIGEDGDGNSISFFDVLASEEPDVCDRVSLSMQAKKLSEVFGDALSARERVVIELRYGLNGDILPQRVIAERLGISRSYVSRIEKTALEKLKKQL